MLRNLEQEDLYKQFHRDEPWDSEHNAKLIPLMPKVFEMPGAKPAPAGHTYYQVFVPTAEYATGRYEPMWGVRKSPGLKEIHDNDKTENTIMIVEAAEPVIWTKPDDIFIDGRIDDLEQPLGFRLGATPKGDECMVCLGSCEIRILRTSLSNPRKYKDALRRVIGYRDGEEVDWTIGK